MDSVIVFEELTAQFHVLALPVVGPFWQSYPWVGARGVALLGVLVAADDAVEHAFGVWAPLDWFWWVWLHGFITP